MSAKDCSDCNGCEHQMDNEGGWCYMFEHRPSETPCAQHDKFSTERYIMEKLILSPVIGPSILKQMINDAKQKLDK